MHAHSADLLYFGQMKNGHHLESGVTGNEGPAEGFRNWGAERYTYI